VAVAKEAVKAAELARRGEVELEQARECALELQANLDAARADLARAQATVEQTQATVRAAQQDEVPLKGRGRWARLRAAWRGE
jgi:hypothetical protein